MTIELAPCPFCSSTNVLVSNQEGFIYVECGQCFAMGPTADFGPMAVRHWNRRPKPSNKQTSKLVPIK